MADNTAQNGTATIAADDIGGVLYQRVKNTFGADGTSTDVDANNPMPVMLRDDDRTFIHLWASGAASGTTTTETAITLTRSGSAGGTTTTGTSFVVTSGKRFRITSITFSSRGNATATAQITNFSIRVNTAGAVTTSSNVWVSGRTATPATALAWDRLSLALDSEGMEVLGNGTIQIGVTANAVFTTNAPTWDVLLTGYEY